MDCRCLTVSPHIAAALTSESVEYAAYATVYLTGAGVTTAWNLQYNQTVMKVAGDLASGSYDTPGAPESFGGAAGVLLGRYVLPRFDD